MTTSATFALHLPIRDIPNSNDRGGWRALARKHRAIRAMTKALVEGMHTTVETPCDLTLTFAFPDKRRRDLENLSGKSLVDGAVDGGLLEDDSIRHIVSITRRLDTHKTEAGMCRITARFTTVGAGS